MANRIARKLNFTKKLLLATAAMLAVAGPVVIGLLNTPQSRAQSQLSVPPAFEVASIKQNKSGENRWLMNSQPGGRFSAANTTLRHLIAGAYGTPQQSRPDSQIAGGPSWIDTDRFDIAAKAAGNPERMQMLPMVRTLLAERFKLSVHNESRELPVYILVMAGGDGKLGSQLHRSEAEDCNAQLAARGNAPTPPGSRGSFCGIMSPAGPPQLMGNSVSMSSLATALARFVDRAVEDRTGLTGNFDFDLQWTSDQLQRKPTATLPPPPSDGPSIFTALQEQLGLKLESTKGPIDVVVVDRAEHPTED